MRGRKFVRDRNDLLSYYLQKVGLNRMGSYIDFPKWLKKKKKKNQKKNPQKKLLKFFSICFNCRIKSSKHYQ